MKAVLSEVLKASAGRRLALFLDYDGTLRPIVERPEDAVLAPETRAVLRALHLDARDVLPLYIGDDLTDEDAFRALAGRGIGIAVQEARRSTAARFILRDPGEVCAFLAGLSRALGRRCR